MVTKFRALADLTRLRLVNLLAYKGELCVCDLEKALEADQPYISRHLAYLKHSGWVQSRREGTWVLYSLPADLEATPKAILATLKSEWEKNRVFRADQDRLDQLIEGGSCRSAMAINRTDTTAEGLRGRESTSVS